MQNALEMLKPILKWEQRENISIHRNLNFPKFECILKSTFLSFQIFIAFEQNLLKIPNSTLLKYIGK